ncbi:hypothetical protein VCRA217O17_70249 [Vibrio crassostreae]|nr:hypothetical protein VCRA217O17_70249 [Vibrio crassostreae]
MAKLSYLDVNIHSYYFDIAIGNYLTIRLKRTLPCSNKYLPNKL